MGVGLASIPVTDLTHFRFYEDDAVNPEDCTAIDAIDTNITRARGIANNFMVRLCIQNGTAATYSGAVTLKYRRNAGTWYTVGATTEVLMTDGTPTDGDGSGASSLLGGTGTYVEGYYDEDDAITPSITVPASGNTEVQFCVYLSAGDLIASDVIEFWYDTPASDSDPPTVYPTVTAS